MHPRLLEMRARIPELIWHALGVPTAAQNYAIAMVLAQ